MNNTNRNDSFGYNTVNIRTYSTHEHLRAQDLVDNPIPSQVDANYGKRIRWGLSLLLSVCLLFCFSPQEGFAKKRKSKKVNNSFPMGCRPVGYGFKLYVLSLYPESAGQRHSMYFMQNINNKAIKLYQQREDNQNNVHANNRINAKQWAVYSTDEKQVNFICSEKDRRYRYNRIIDCAKVLRVCEFTNVKYGLNNQGNYWSTTNTSKKGAMRAVNRQGILLRR